MVSKPALRNLLLNKTRKDFTVVLTVAISLALGYKFGVMEARRQLFDNFHKTYNIEKDYARMKRAGIFQYNLTPDED